MLDCDVSYKLAVVSRKITTSSTGINHFSSNVYFSFRPEDYAGKISGIWTLPPLPTYFVFGTGYHVVKEEQVAQLAVSIHILDDK